MILKALHSLEGHSDRVWTLAWNQSGTVLASSGADKIIRLWSQDKNSSWVCSSILADTHSKSIRRLCWSPCGSYLASASFDSTVCIWRKHPVDGWSTLVNLEGHESEVKSVAWSSDGRFLASCSRDRTIWIWERTSDCDEDADENEPAENWDCSDIKSDHSKDVKHILWHPHQNILASCGYDDTVKLFHKDTDEWKCYETLTAHSATVWSASFDATGQYLATCSDDKTVRVWKNHSHDKLPDVEPNSWKCTSVLQGFHSRSIYDVSWCKLNDIIASGSGDNSIAIYTRDSSDPANRKDFTCTERVTEAHHCDVNALAWNPKIPGLLASASDDRRIKLWACSPEEKGMTPMTIVDELLMKLSAANLQSETENSDDRQQTEPVNLTLNIDNFSNLLHSIQILQQLQTELCHDEQLNSIEKLLDLKICNNTWQPVRLTNLIFDDQEDGAAKEFHVEITNNCGQVSYNFRLIISTDKYKMKIPHRSSKLSAVSGELFLIERTGDLYKLSESGESKFLLGHLFTFSDVQFVVDEDKNDIIYIISADRDEKIRVSNYPDTFNIERYCFGHKHNLSRLVVIEGRKFVSLDQQDQLCVWDLNDLKNPALADKPLKPVQTTDLHGIRSKRVCTRLVASLESTSLLSHR